jgi:hypothetical protein
MAWYAEDGEWYPATVARVGGGEVAVRLGLGRIVASEIEAPNTLANMV